MWVILKSSNFISGVVIGGGVYVAAKCLVNLCFVAIRRFELAFLDFVAYMSFNISFKPHFINYKNCMPMYYNVIGNKV